jgi:hypothetical protein
MLIARATTPVAIRDGPTDRGSSGPAMWGQLEIDVDGRDVPALTVTMRPA